MWQKATAPVMTDTVPAAVKPPPAWMLWQNPVFLRYCRSRLRVKALIPGLILTVIFSAFAYLVTPLVALRVDEERVKGYELMKEQWSAKPGGREEFQRIVENQWQLWARTPPSIKPDYMYQRMVLLPLLGIQALVLFVLGTGQVAGGMTAERDEGMVDYQRLTPTTPVAKVAGYLFGLPVREWALFLATVPFTALGLWYGQVPPEVWGPVAVVFFTSVILYHMTGLVSGTVFKSRRWAFLFSMGMVFLLYSLVPQGARFGLPFLRYITMWPAAMEAAYIFPAEQVQAWRLASGHTSGAGVKFFEWTFSDFVFTLIVQGSFILAMVVMVWRKWRDAESHLLSKPWALMAFTWLCFLPIGNALPGIEDGSLFPVRDMRSRFFSRGSPGDPGLMEAGLITGFYGLLMLSLLILLTVMLTPSADGQARGLQRASKLGRRGAPFFSDESSAFPIVLLLIMGGAASWTWFTRSVLGSDWFYADPGPLTFFLCLGVLAPPILCLHALLEWKGSKWAFFTVVFLGIVPLLAALVVLASSRNVPVTAITIAGASPFAQALYLAEGFLPWRHKQEELRIMQHAVDRVLLFWPAAYLLVTVFFLNSLRRHWKSKRPARNL